MIKSKKALLLEAQNEQIDTITAIRLSLLEALNDLAEMGGSDNYERGLEAIIKASGADGISLSKLRVVLPDAAKLTDAREALGKLDKLEEVGDGKSIVIKPGANMIIAQAAEQSE